MPFERIMGLNVTDDEEYQRYREGMTPLLHAAGGSFGFDFKIAEVLQSKTDNQINRVFTITFPSEKIMEEFFANPEYLAIKDRHFEHSVQSKTIIAMHETTT